MSFIVLIICIYLDSYSIFYIVIMHTSHFKISLLKLIKSTEKNTNFFKRNFCLYLKKIVKYIIF